MKNLLLIILSSGMLQAASLNVSTETVVLDMAKTEGLDIGEYCNLYADKNAPENDPTNDAYEMSKHEELWHACIDNMQERRILK